MKKRIPAICMIIFFIALVVGIPVLRVAFAHASTATGNESETYNMADSNTPATASATSVSATNNMANGNTPATPSATGASMSFAPACPPAPVGYARCMAMVSTTTVNPTFATPNAYPNFVAGGGVAAHTALATGSAAPYSPMALHNAYNLPTTATNVQTIAIVDAFDDPNAESDLGTYRSMFGLPACTTANGCFSKVNQTGGMNYPTTNTSWGLEISLDLDMASAICQNCHILLVEANSSSLTDLGASVNEAATLGANEISNSYGSAETADESTACSTFYNHPGVAVTASSGDAGLGVEFPSACPDVTGVGGTTLNPGGTETAWNTSADNGAGGGCSTQIAIPTWEVQTVTNCANRSVSDVSADADPNTGVYVFDTFGQGGGLQIGGTSAASPIIAATFALANGTAGNASSASIPWTQRNAGCLNTVGGMPYAFQTGLGSPEGITCF